MSGTTIAINFITRTIMTFFTVIMVLSYGGWFWYTVFAINCLLFAYWLVLFWKKELK